MRPLPLALAVAACLAVPGTAAAQALNGFVNSDQTIGLTQGGTPVTQLAPGTYSFEVNDTTAEHNFHLQGPGVNDATGIEATGIFSWVDRALRTGSTTTSATSIWLRCRARSAWGTRCA